MLAEMASEFDDLLSGLGSDDLDDFDEVAETPVGKGQEKLNVEFGPKSDDDLNMSWRREHSSQDPFLARKSAPTSFAGFATAAGRVLSPPPSPALAKARRLLGDIPSSDDDVSDAEPSTSAKRRKIDHVGLHTGAGRALPLPSKDAFARASAFFSDELETAEEPAIPPGAFTGFATGGGRALRPPSKAAMDRIARIFGDDEEMAAEVSALHGDQTLGPSSRPTFTTGSFAPVAPVSEKSRSAVANIFGATEAVIESDRHTPFSSSPASQHISSESLPSSSRDRVLALFDDADTKSAPNTPSCRQTPNQPRSAYGNKENVYHASPLPPPRGPSMSMAPTQPALSTPRPLAAFQTPAPLGTRTPLRTTTNQPTKPLFRPLSGKPIVISSTPGNRRIGLGSTPGTARGTKTKAFVTPFKTPSAVTPSIHRSGRGGPTATGTPEAKPAAISLPHVEVFDLQRPTNRKTMKQAHLKPGYYSPGEMAEIGLPDEIWKLDSQNAMYYQFIAEDASTLGHINAYNILKREGCHLVTQRWVDNHWSLILWKLAGQIQAQISLFDQRWNWGEVIEQLKYRYEREFGAAQRPIVRRIQERDSSAAVPMVLVISAVHRPGPVEGEDGKMQPSNPHLELSDGWYRINAQVDDCLGRAINKGKLRVGRKIAVSGAKLDSFGDGEEVLEALNKSRLVISGNSCSFARWDARLGHSASPFIAGLSSLSSDGGVVVLMDIRIERVHPLAFMDGVKGMRGEIWNESEEAEKADSWNDLYETESKRLGDEMRLRLDSMEELVNQLISAAEGVSASANCSPPGNLDNLFDRLLSAPSQLKTLSTMSDKTLVHLASHASQRLESELRDGQDDVQAALRSTVPPRNIRDFRIVRFVDAREGYKDPARVGMLNVWDARNLGDSIEEGKRYLVSNLYPGKNGDWSVPKQAGKREIYLNTRQNTRWHLLD